MLSPSIQSPTHSVVVTIDLSDGTYKRTNNKKVVTTKLENGSPRLLMNFASVKSAMLKACRRARSTESYMMPACRVAMHCTGSLNATASSSVK
jgi:hypothetical protein